MKLETWFGKYNVKPYYAYYQSNGTLAIVLMEKDEEFDTITTNLEIGFASGNKAYVDTNNCSWAEKFINDNKLGKFTGEYGYSGYCQYPLYEFDLSKMKKLEE